MEPKLTGGAWDVACDSYGSVRHARKACVYTVVHAEGGDRIVTVAGRIENWADARLMAAAPWLLAAAKRLRAIAVWDEDFDASDRREFDAAMADVDCAIAAAEP